MEKVEYKGYLIEISRDEFAESPREFCEEESKMICSHKRYNLGDEQFDSSDFLSWEGVEAHYAKENIILPLYLYDHGGITMNTTGFHCRWDSGQVGVIAWNKAKIRDAYGWKRITQKRKEQIEKYMVDQVKTYDSYLTGDVYHITIRDIKSGDSVDSCGGFYGNEDDNVLIYAKEMIDSIKN